jgi:IclR family acetate operon transcriptional repressor
MTSAGAGEGSIAQATNSLDRAILVLDLIGHTPGGLSNAEISSRLKIPRSTTSFILGHLEKAGYVKRDELTRRYCVGLRALILANHALREIGFRASAEPVLHKLVYDTGLIATLCVLEGDRVLLVDRVETPNVAQDIAANFNRLAYSYPSNRSGRDVGASIPAYASSLGRVLLASQTPERRLAILKARPPQKITPKTCVSIPELMEELERVKAQKYSLTDQELHMSARGLAVPVVDSEGHVRATVGLAGNRDDAVWDDIDALLRRLRLVARTISQTLI